jgi:tellurite resistance protein
VADGGGRRWGSTCGRRGAAPRQLHPGYFIPTVAGGLLASVAAAQVGQTGLAWVLFGYGMIAWLVIGLIILGRLFFGPRLPEALVPTLAIQVAPGAVASLAWFSLDGGRIDTVARLLAGYGVLMVVAQVRLLPAFLRLRFSGAFWAFAFSWTAVATVGLHWIREVGPAGSDVGTALVLAAAALLVGAIAVRTVVALYRGELFPRAAVPDPPSFAAWGRAA